MGWKKKPSAAYTEPGEEPTLETLDNGSFPGAYGGDDGSIDSMDSSYATGSLQSDEGEGEDNTPKSLMQRLLGPVAYLFRKKPPKVHEVRHPRAPSAHALIHSRSNTLIPGGGKAAAARGRQRNVA